MTGILGHTANGARKCESLRPRDTVTGSERQPCFAGLAKAGAQPLSSHDVYFSPGRRFCVLVHAHGMAVADLVAQREWPTALSWEHAPQGPRQFSPLFFLLEENSIAVAGLQEPVKLKTALEYISDRLGGKLPVLVNKAAFEEELGANAEDPYEEEVSLPPVPKTSTAGTALRLMLAQIGKGKATYVVRRNYIEITTRKHAGEDEVLTPVFSARGTYVAVAEGLSNEHKLHIIECATGQRLATFPLHAEIVAYFGSTPDEELLYFFANDRGKPLFTIWSTQSKQVVRTIPEMTLPRDIDLFLLSPDGRTLLFDGNAKGTTGADLFDLRTGKKRHCFDDRKPDMEAEKLWHYLFSPEGRYLVRIGRNLTIWDIAAGKTRCVIDLNRMENLGDGYVISADSKVIASPHREQGFTAWSLETGERLWPPKPPTAVFADVEPNPPGVLNVQEGPIRVYPRITPDYRYFVDSTDGRIDLLEPTTGKTFFSVKLGAKTFPPHQIKFTPDGRWMLSVWQFDGNRQPWLVQKWLGKWWPIDAPRGCAIVTEVATGRTDIRVSDYGASYDLSDDGGTLTACWGHTDNKGTICIYDVPGRPSRYVVVGIPLVLAAVVILFQWRGYRKKRPLQTAAPI